MKFLVLNVQVATKCPHPGCDGLATLERVSTTIRSSWVTTWYASTGT